MIKAVVFDIDDTLAPEISFVKSGYKAVAKSICQDMTEIMTFLGGKNDFFVSKVENRLWNLFKADSQNVFNRLLDEYDISYDKNDILELVRIYREHEIDTSVYSFYDDVVSVVDALRIKGIKLGILSDGFMISQKNKVSALGCDKLFDEIVLTDELGREYWKPSPKGFEILINRFGVEPSELLYVGDNPKKDFAVKEALPIKTARIIRENGVYKEASYSNEIKEDYRLSSLDELLQPKILEQE